MKTLLLTLFFLGNVIVYSQGYDSWQKSDTTKTIQRSSSLKDSLPGNSEMKILPAQQNPNNQNQTNKSSDIKIISGKKAEQSSPTKNVLNEEGKVTIMNRSNGWEIATPNNTITIGKTPRFMSSRSTYPKFKGHWTGFYYGFINSTTPDYSMYPANTKDFMELDWAGSFNLQFNLCKYSIGLSRRNNFGLVTGFGLDYQRLRFADKSLSITMVDGKVTPVELPYLFISGIRRSSFKTLYLTIPLLMEVQFPARYQRSNSLYFSGGVVGGVRMHSKTKVVYFDDGKHKKKDKDSFNMIPFKADVAARIGYRGLTVWGSYTLTHLFKGGKGPEMNLYTVGLGFMI